MSDEIKVSVVKFPDRTNLMLRYIDPATRKQKHKSAGTKKHGDAVKAAGKWEDDLRSGRYAAPSRITWEEFRDRHESEVQSGLAAETGRVLFSVFNMVERILRPNRLADLTAERLSYFQSKLREPDAEGIQDIQAAHLEAVATLKAAREAGRRTTMLEGRVEKLNRMLDRAKNAHRSEATIRTYLAHLHAALKWAADVELIRTAPKVKMPARAKGQKVMKGRPIIGEEFDRLLMATPKIVGDAGAAAWTHYLTGLWCSGLRLTESLQLYWDRSDRLCVDLAGRHPVMCIPAAHEKGNQDRVLAIAPEFAEFLAKTPDADRRGRVFKLTDRDGTPREFGEDWVGKMVSRIGKSAGVAVNTDQRGRVKFASAHDLRRSFGERWATRVMPQVLKELMRHESIDTTMRYYVGRNAQTTASVLWELTILPVVTLLVTLDRIRATARAQSGTQSDVPSSVPKSGRPAMDVS